MLPKLTDREIEEACRLLSAYEVATIPPEDTYTDIRSADYTAYMDDLISKSEAGVLRAPDVPMGWQYYTRKAVAAALIAALLAGIAMPERVMAGYRWLVEVVEQFFEDRKTEYRYTSNADEDVEFVPMQFGYLPEGMEVTRNSIDEDGMNVMYKGSDCYFSLKQVLITEDTEYGLALDTENAKSEQEFLFDNVLKLIYKDDVITYVWNNDKYLIWGKCDLTKEELIKILTHILIR